MSRRPQSAKAHNDVIWCVCRIIVLLNEVHSQLEAVKLIVFEIVLEPKATCCQEQPSIQRGTLIYPKLSVLAPLYPQSTRFAISARPWPTLVLWSPSQPTNVLALLSKDDVAL